MNLYQPTITGSLSVSGSVNISGSITIEGGGTISGTASIATTALTASSADNLLVRNTLTAQTLVVQTITSSVDFVTGSTRFGSLAANTHVFTGSMSVSGSATFASSVQINQSASEIQQIINSNATSKPSITQYRVSNSSGWETGMASLNDSYSYIFSYGTFGTTNAKLTLTSTGNVGIGISPSYKLDINRGSSGVVLNLEGTNAYDAETGILMSAGRAKISGFLNTGGGTPGTSLRFYTMPDEGSVTERVRITSGGDTRFIFRNSSSEVMDLQLSTETASPSKSKISLLWYGNETTSIKFRRGDDSTGGNLEFWTQPTGGSITQRMSILSSGNVGIGTTSPGAALVIASTQGNSSTYQYLTFRNLANGYGTWGISKRNSNDLGITYATDSDTPDGGTSIFMKYGGGIGFNTTSLETLFDVADSSTNTLMAVKNTSTANSTGKNAMYGFIGTDTVGTPKAVGGMQAAPNDVNWVNGWLYWYVRSGDGQTLRMSLSNGGAMVISGALTQNGSPSDINLKENLVKITSPLEKISQINGYSFEWKEGTPARGNISNIVEDAGVIAQEIEEVMPEIVRMSDDNKVVNYNGLVALLIEGMKELKAEFDAYKATHP